MDALALLLRIEKENLVKHEANRSGIVLLPDGGFTGLYCPEAHQFAGEKREMLWRDGGDEDV